jgi:hypothetical protein
VKDASVTVSEAQTAFLTFTNNTKTEEGALLDNVSVVSTGAGSGVSAISLLVVAAGCVLLFFLRPAWLGKVG